MGKKETLTRKFAVSICDAHEILQTMENQEERHMLQEHNPDLYYAYIWMLQTAYPKDGRWLI